jgi:serine/threonine protein kinase
MTTDPESRLPVLLMELLDQNLTTMLEQSQQSLSYGVQVGICTDIAVAIAYLHSNGIIHRDLSSNNVLIIADRRAKVTDFGMSKLVDATTTTPVPSTMCPGTKSYMPPEAFREPPTYTQKMDCFAIGVIMIQVCTQLWPEPGPRTELVPFPDSPTGNIEMPVLERKRRKNHIDLIDPAHPFLTMVMDCLSHEEINRPSANDLCEKLENLKRVAWSNECIHTAKSNHSDSTSTDELERQIVELRVAKEREIRELEVQISEQQNETDLLLNELQAMKEHVVQLHMKNATLHRQIEHLQLRLQSTALSANLQSQGSHTFSRTSKLELTWKSEQTDTPVRMRMEAAVINGDVVYFMGADGRLYSYSLTSKYWHRLPDCPYEGITLAIVKSLVTAIGGISRDLRKVTNMLNCLKFDGEQPKWLLNHYPPMPTERYNATAVSTDNFLIVAGGQRGDKCLNVVEVMDTDSLEWTTVASLPYPFNGTSLTVCRDKVYMLGGWGDEVGSQPQSILACSLADLFHSGSSGSAQQRRDFWHSISSVPVNNSTYTTLCTVSVRERIPELLACTVGPSESVSANYQNTPNSGTIYRYNQITSMWEFVDNMPLVRVCCTVVMVSNSEMMVIGEVDNVSHSSVNILCSFNSA